MGLRVLVCASEVVPFAKTGGLADVAGALPKALAALGHDVRVAMPRYSVIDGKKFKLSPLGAPFRVSLGANTEVSVLVSDAIPGVKTYLIDSPKHFDRKSLYGDADDGERFALVLSCRARVPAQGRLEAPGHPLPMTGRPASCPST